MNTTDKSYFYILLKLLEEFDRSEETSSYENVRTMINNIQEDITFQRDEKIFFEVAELLSLVRKYPLEKINLETRLKEDLKMSQMDKKFMRVPFNYIIKKFGGSKWVTNANCIACKNVEDCVGLIKLKLS